MKRMTRPHIHSAAALLILCLNSQMAFAINKCTDANGQVSYQEAPCALTAKSAAAVKTWENSSHTGTRNVQPNLKLEAPAAAAPLLSIYRRWADAERLATSTSRIALAGPAAAMQSLQRETEALQVPTCLASAKMALADLITKSSDAILQFMVKEEVTGMAYQIVHRSDLIQRFEKAAATAKCS